MKKSGQTALNGRFQIITHQGVPIVIANYGLGTREEVWALTNYIDEWLGRQKPDSVNIFFDFHKIPYEAAHVNHWKKSLGRYDAIIHKSCFVNASPLILIVATTVRAFATFTGTPMKKNRGVFFKDKDAAMDWLAEP